VAAVHGEKVAAGGAAAAGAVADRHGGAPVPPDKGPGQGRESKGPPPQWSWRWWHDLIFGNRFDHPGRGKRFVILLMGMLAVTVAVYVVLHNIFPPKASALRARDFVQLNHHGEATIKSVEDINWFIGEKKAGPLLQALQVRNVQIRDLCEHIRLSLGDLQARLGPASVEDIRPVLEAFEGTNPPEVPHDEEDEVKPLTGWRRCLHDLISGQSSDTNRPTAALTLTNLAALRDDLKKLQVALDQNQLRNEEWSRWEEQVSVNLTAGLDRLANDLRMESTGPCCTDELAAGQHRWETNLTRLAELRQLVTNTNLAAGLDSLANDLRLAFMTPGCTNDAAASQRRRETNLTRLADLRRLVLAQPFRDETNGVNTNTATAKLTDIRCLLGNLKAALPDQGHEASLAFAAFQARLTQGDRDAAGFAQLSDLHTSLLKLEALTAEQVGVVLELRQPEKFGMFWSNSTGVLWEITFWAFFGVFTNLLLNITEQLSQGNYRPVECWVSIAKLVYGPSVALALGIALIAGFISLLGEEQRVWVLPLLAFLAGFKARKAASVLDNLATSLLDKMDKSIGLAPADRLAAINESDRRLQALIPPPGTLSELKTQGKRKAEALATATVARKVSGH
jgi:hypothetical protein